MRVLNLQVPQDLREMSFVLSQWGMWTRIGLDIPTDYRCQLASLVDLAKLKQRSTATLYLSDAECGAVDALMGILKHEKPVLFDWLDAHYRQKIPLKRLAKEGRISEHKVVQILIKSEECLMGIARRIESQVALA